MFPASARSQAERELPLHVFTPIEWAESALGDEISLLNDHAHLERKAATNALLLLHRWPDVLAEEKGAVHAWTGELTQIAEEEIDHLSLVLRLLEKRGGVFNKGHRSQYAADLRKVERCGTADGDLVDRLMVSALIEARSCERFLLLGTVAESEDLKKLFCGLWASEHGHYRTFLDLAARFTTQFQLEERWQEMLAAEAEIIQKQEPGSRIHSWLS